MPAVTLPWLEVLQNPALYNHPVRGFKVVETHISWVLLTGPFAYKIKKPVNLGFLDFSTLEKRRFYCEEEVRINRRLCPDLYEGVVALTGERTHPELDGKPPPFDYMVKMKQFDEDLLWDRMLQRQELPAERMDELAMIVANFHKKAAVAPVQSAFGRPDTFWKGVQATLRHIGPSLHGTRENALYDQISTWLKMELNAKADRMLERLRDGCVREGHGDLHLSNIALFSQSRPDILVFDAIEFDENLRWIDVIDDAAFLVMDLKRRGRADLAWRFLNGYLEITGDYKAMDLLRLYAANRAIVRAKVLGIQAGQIEDRRERVALHSETRRFLRLAESYTHSTLPCLYITHGLSGSGKTTWTKRMAETLGAVRIRSDIERKRLFGLPSDASSSEDLKPRMYGAEGNERTYARLKDLTTPLLKAGYTVIIDAAFLKQEPRHHFRDLAARCQAGFRILDFRADEETLRCRIRARMRDKKDASEADLAVLEEQIQDHEDLAEAEKPFVVTSPE